ncbi:hypothetical protein AB0N95_36245 [Streptomyces microflavus]|uniref:hypothetical protein n=2 Tax=Streptomyces TaxID=1883 RepID=UPI00342A9601
MKDTVDLGHSGYRAYRSESRRARAERRPPPELTGGLAREWAARLPEHDVTGLLRELVVSVHPADGTAFRWARPVRHALAGLLRHDIEAPGGQPVGVHRPGRGPGPERLAVPGPVLQTGPLLPRVLLDLAAADAAAGVPLAERLHAWPKIVKKDAALHDRILAAHPPLPGADATAAGQWWDLAAETVVRLLAAPPLPEGARLTALMVDTGPLSRTGGLQQRISMTLGPPPSTGSCRPAPTRPASAGPEPWRAQERSLRPRGCGCGPGPRSCPRRHWPTSLRCWTHCVGAARPVRPTRRAVARRELQAGAKGPRAPAKPMETIWRLSPAHYALSWAMREPDLMQGCPHPPPHTRRRIAAYKKGWPPPDYGPCSRS